MDEFTRRNLDTADFFDIDEDDEDTLANKYLTFKTGKESYGISIRHIREIIEIQKISEMPEMPSYVKGVINLRGRVIPVIDLRLRFHMETREYDDRTCIIITEVNQVLIGFIVDSVEEVVEIQETQIEPPPRFKTVEGHDRYISGIGKTGQTVKIILDIEKIIVENDLDSITGTISEQK